MEDDFEEKKVSKLQTLLLANTLSAAARAARFCRSFWAALGGPQVKKAAALKMVGFKHKVMMC